MNGYGSKWKIRYTFPVIQMVTRTVWMITNRQLPRNPVTRSAIRAPSVVSAASMTLTGWRQRPG